MGINNPQGVGALFPKTIAHKVETDPVMNNWSLLNRQYAEMMQAFDLKKTGTVKALMMRHAREWFRLGGKS